VPYSFLINSKTIDFASILSKMADDSESTPFLADNDHTAHIDDSENHDTGKTLSPSAHFKRLIKIMKIILAFLSLSAFGLLIAAFVIIKPSPNTYYTWDSKQIIKELGTCVILPTPTLKNN
jgi:hypothetical protein